MKKILLHSAAVDNAGNYCDAGCELEISDATEAGHIAPDRAADMVEANRAIDAAKADDGGDGLDAMTIAELRDLAEEESVDLDGLTLKADIVRAIRGERVDPPSELSKTILSPQLDPPLTDA